MLVDHDPRDPRQPSDQDNTVEATYSRNNQEYAGLIAAVLDGDLQARVELAMKVQDWAYRWGLKVVKNSDDAADIAQECVLRVFKYLEKIDLRRSPAGFIGRIIRSVTCNRMTQRDRVRRQRSLTVDGEGKDGTMGLTGLETPGEDDPAAQAGRKELLERVHAELARLTPRQREAFVLRYMVGMSCREAAECMKATLCAVEQLTFKARSRLRVSLQNAGWDHV